MSDVCKCDSPTIGCHPIDSPTMCERCHKTAPVRPEDEARAWRLQQGEYAWSDFHEDGTHWIASSRVDKLLAAFAVHIRQQERERCGFDFRAHLQRQREFSEKTFGPGARTQGLIDHIKKELKEIAAKPDDLSEWIDVAILALDGAWRAGYSPDQIISALVAKQDKNEKREWPDWRTADPNKAIEHVRIAAAIREGD